MGYTDDIPSPRPPSVHPRDVPNGPDTPPRRDLPCIPGNSFSGNTLVTTADGLRPISAIAVGDMVLAYDESTQSTGYFTVTDVLIHEDALQVHLSIGDEFIETTPEHPFYTQKRGWIAAVDLALGEQVRQRDGRYTAVTAIWVEREQQVMYNLTVAGAHTFFVGEQQWLVHNAGCNPLDLPVLTKQQAIREIASGSSTNVLVRHRDEAREIFEEIFAGQGYRNSTGYTGNQVRQNPDLFPDGKAGTFHWDYEDTQHGGVPHLQIHTHDGDVIRIFFKEGAGNPIRTPPK